MKNTIYYGPPGTGKTYFIQNKLKDYTTIEITDSLISSSLSNGKEWLVIALAILQNNNIATNTHISSKLTQLGISTNSTVSTILTRHSTTDTPLGSYDNPRIFVSYNGSWYVDIDLFKSLESNIYNKYILNSSKKRYEFVTFHQSFVYEDFIEGIKPKLNTNSTNSIEYEIQDGIFKNICKLARDCAPQKCAIFIDEINRGNVSEIFGELLSLIEPDKREGQPLELKVTLPYSKVPFGIPSNLDIYGTMNSADKSISNIDIALRRRFEFVPIKSNPDLLLNMYSSTTINPNDIDGINIIELLRTINSRIELLLDSNYNIGHAYFANISSFDDIKAVIVYKVIPLLEEYFYNDPEKVQLILNDLDENGDLDINALYIHKEIDASSLLRYFGDYDIDNKKIYSIKNIDEISKESILKIYEH
ncbi:hypothetical protein CHF27_013240 [Romboutsia maritimum]|uniref:ATPase dynein-related AAA domain-containing protein n=1 Tax=Romboutsia maritimum TaxID=2020948 RepID=A0A371IPS2_9FIRM|nr:AAA family ATPase [Romboutsia maritimum]RDY22476.1 hypothetical protein CHF27_013240 [Romboutsia maritimum]